MQTFTLTLTSGCQSYYSYLNDVSIVCIKKKRAVQLSGKLNNTTIKISRNILIKGLKTMH